MTGRLWKTNATAVSLWLGGVAALVIWAASHGDVKADQTRDTLRVCAAPNNLPFSNRAGEGFENRIAQVFAKDLGATVEYTWYPMQMGFGRNTLGEFDEEKGRYRCDLIVGITSGLEAGQTTAPYYYSTYTAVYRPNAALRGIEDFDDLFELPEERREELRIGLFAGSPVTQQLLRHGLSDQIISYRHQSGSADVTPGTVIRQDLVGGKLDMVIVWGPIGGYFADPSGHCADCKDADLRLLKIESGPGRRYHFGISMGVRYSDDEWLETVESLIEENRTQIDRILREYNVPRVNASGAPIKAVVR